MANLRKLKALAAKLGATVEVDRIGDTVSCEVFAPPGKFWCEGGTHVFVEQAYLPWKPDYADLVSRMGYGLEDCTDAECEWCHPL